MKMPKIKSATDVRKHLYDTLKEVSEGDPQIVTHRQGEAVVLISQRRFNALIEEKEVLEEIALGVADLKAGNTVTHEEALKQLREHQRKWK
jgi:prevent-host-death family protein